MGLLQHSHTNTNSHKKFTGVTRSQRMLPETECGWSSMVADSNTSEKIRGILADYTIYHGLLQAGFSGRRHKMHWRSQVLTNLVRHFCRSTVTDTQINPEFTST